MPKSQASGSCTQLQSLGVRSGTVDDRVSRSSFVYGRFDACERTLKDVECGGLCNESTLLRHIGCGYEALRDWDVAGICLLEIGLNLGLGLFNRRL
jgi:hypothetical protein